MLCHKLVRLYDLENSPHTSESYDLTLKTKEMTLKTAGRNEEHARDSIILTEVHDLDSSWQDGILLCLLRYPTKRLVQKNVSEMTYFGLNGM